MNHSKIFLIKKLFEHFIFIYTIRTKDNKAVTADDLWRVAADMHPRLEEYVAIYNECVELISRLSPTMNTTFHILMEREFKKPLHLIPTNDLYKVKDMLINRL